MLRPSRETFDRRISYASFSTVTLISAVTSRNTLMVTGNSPMVLSGSPDSAFPLSLLNPRAPSPSPISPHATEPRLLQLAPGLPAHLLATALRHPAFFLPPDPV